APAAPPARTSPASACPSAPRRAGPLEPSPRPAGHRRPRPPPRSPPPATAANERPAGPASGRPPALPAQVHSCPCPLPRGVQVRRRRHFDVQAETRPRPCFDPQGPAHLGEALAHPLQAVARLQLLRADRKST